MTQKISFDLLHPQPLLIVISGPSGVGKDAVLHEMKRRGLPIHFVVTATTRLPRPEENNGVDYFFVSHDEFSKMIAENELIEYSMVYKDFKGVPRAQVKAAIASGKDVALRVDVQGAAKLRALCPDALLIFLVPSSVEDWYKRLLERPSQKSENLELRVETAVEEMACLENFDYVVINAQDRLGDCVDTIEAIIKTEHQRVKPRRITL
jgi:guanylate kinase